MTDRRQRLNDTTTMTRRNFTLEAALAVLAGCVITLTDACSKDSTPAQTPAPTAAPVDINGTISDNHNHAALLTGAQIAAGNAITVSIQGTATHPHTVALTQADLQTLTNRRPVTRDSSSDLSGFFGQHMHTVTFTPA
jgi:hypothetical protein